MIRLRPFDHSQQDYESLAALYTNANPDQPASSAFEQRQDRSRDPAHFWRRTWAIWQEETGHTEKLAGLAVYGHMPWEFHPQKFFLDIVVHPAYRRRGIGTTLYDHAVTQLAPFQPLALESQARENHREGLRFLAKRDFHVVSHQQESELDPSGFEVTPFLPSLSAVADAGIIITTLRERRAQDPDCLRQLYDLHCQLLHDVPWHTQATMADFEFWQRGFHDNPDLLADAYAIAIHEGQYVGVSELWASQATDTLLYTGFTGVHRHYRRRGIATALKVHAIQYARTLTSSTGKPPVIRTDNNIDNPMLDLNLRLGFVKIPGRLIHVKNYSVPG